MSEGFNEVVFRRLVDESITKVQQILQNTKHPQYASEVNHSYEDKYHLSEFLTRVAIAAHLNCLFMYGLDGSSLSKLIEWASIHQKSVTVRLKAEEKCTFLREEEKQYDSESKLVSNVTFGGSMVATLTGKVVTTVKEYYWNVDFSYELIAFYGAEDQITDRVVLKSRKSTQQIKTTTKVNPRKEIQIYSPRDMNITWLLQHVERDNFAINFGIERGDKKCRTPRRNQNIEDAIHYFDQVKKWSEEIIYFFKSIYFPIAIEHSYDLSCTEPKGIFIPIVPLLEEYKKNPMPAIENDSNDLSDETLLSVSNKSKSPILSKVDIDALLTEHMRSMQEKCDVINATLPSADGTSLISTAEGILCAVTEHGHKLSQQYSMCVAFIEDMLRAQLTAAIGKVVTPVDFSTYMSFHNRRLFLEHYQPRPFSYFVRRSDSHGPEGTVSIEQRSSSGDMMEPIETLASRRGHVGDLNAKEVPVMEFSLSASTKVSFKGDRYVHGWMAHIFAMQPHKPHISLMCRAKQFSSFIVLIGKIASGKVFQPKYGMIIQNKDELDIPLLFEQVPSAKEFRDAIESLSPEQQRFAKAYRSLQLEGSVLAVCIVQIKPQLEVLLRLAPESLTKEIALTQDLMDLFIKYQIPSDLLSYDGPPTASDADRLTAVKNHVAAMQDMINKAKAVELKGKVEEAVYTHLDAPPQYDPFVGNSSQELQMSEVRKSTTQRSASAFFSTARSVPPPAYSAPPVAMMRSAPAAAYYSSRAMTMDTVQLRGESLSLVANDLMGSVDEAECEASVTSDASELGNSLTNDKHDHPLETHADDAPVDYTKIPTLLDKRFDGLDEDSSIRSNIITPSDKWTKKAQQALLGKPVSSTLRSTEHKSEKDRAFDLLDALTRSGALCLDHASLHVLFSYSHCFDKSVFSTVVEDNVNPIERVERAMLVLGSVINGVSPLELVHPQQKMRVTTYSPKLLESSA